MDRASWMALAGMGLVTMVALALAWRSDQENRALRIEVESMQARLDAMERVQARATRGGAGRPWPRADRPAPEASEATPPASQPDPAERADAAPARDDLLAQRQEQRRERVLDATAELTRQRGYDAETSEALLALVERSLDDTFALRGARRAGEVDPTTAQDELAAARQQVEDEVVALLGEEEGDAFLQALRDARAASLLGARGAIAP